jgi:hypothetical protein
VFVEECESSPRFDRLITSDWGTPEAKAPWWRFSYWQDRSAAADIVTKSGKTSFAEVRDEYAKGKQNVATYDAEIAQVAQRIKFGESLDQEYAQLYDEHQTLDARGLEHTRHRLVEHLLGVDAATMTQRLRAAASPFLMLFLRASGLAAKASYLDGIFRNNAGEIERDLAAQKGKLDNVEQRTRRRWQAMPAEKYQSLAVDRRAKYDKRFERWGKVYNTVYVYDRWDRARYYDDLLWWDLMTRGRYDGSFLPEVEAYHRLHPGYAFDPDWKTRAANRGDRDEEDDADAAAESLRADKHDTTILAADGS